jgi:hypothetical protein
MPMDVDVYHTAAGGALLFGHPAESADAAQVVSGDFVFDQLQLPPKS